MPTSYTPPAAPYMSGADFTAGQLAWNTLVETGNSDALSQAFTLNNSGTVVRIGGLSFPIACIKQVLSAVSVHYIEVRFVLLPPALAQFGAVLYATDKDGTPLTAYYGPGTPLPVGTLGVADSPIPTVLAADWISAWQHTSPLRKAMFLSDHQALEGYSFEVESFVRALFAVGNNPSLPLLLGAHEYYGPGYDGTPTSKFGVIVAALASTSTGPAVAGEVFMDMAMPRPPY